MGHHYTNTRASKVSVGLIDFLPGETREVDDKLAGHLEAKKRDKHVHPLRKGGNPILRKGVVEMPEPPPIAKLPTLEDLDPVRALAQVKLCEDLDLLASWHATEKRPDIQTAIDRRGQELAAKK